MKHTGLGVVVLALLFGVACNSGPAQQTPAVTGTTGLGEPAASGPPPDQAAATQPASPAAAIPAVAIPAADRFKEVTIPAGTRLSLTLENALSSDNSKPEDPVRARLSQAIVVDGTTIVPAGAEVSGTVLEARQSGKVKGRASLAFRFNQLRSAGRTHDIRTARISRAARATKGNDAKKIGIGAGAGAVIGAIAGGKKGAAIGTAVGGGAGTGAVLATSGQEVQLGPGAAITTTLEAPVKILVPLR
jgi:hypothetical protein